ncbi:SDR family NAD(P)-dependent oxidoreductase, partial [Paenibacillus sp. S150]|uniref:SDR family NAD(P)-dependent oxidoreductase n=1 Tax=Paenibacillus sp. S150 TaxID=2749826 RepID=UPI001C5987BC
MDKLKIFQEVAKQGLSVTEAMALIRQEQSESWITFHHNDPYVSDHLVYGNAILLGVTYCSIALDAEIKQAGGQPVTLSRFLFRKPVVVGTYRKVCIRVAPQKGSTLAARQIEYRYSSAERSEVAAVYELKQEGTEPDRDKTKLDITEFIHSSERVVESHTIYQRMLDVQVEFGDSLKTVQRAWIRGSEVLSELRMSPVHNNDLLTIHPVFLDGAIVGSMAPYSASEPKPFIPMSIGEIIFFERNSGPVCYSLAEVVRRNAELLVINLAIYSEKGQLLVQLREVSLKRARLEGLLDVRETVRQEEIVTPLPLDVQKRYPQPQQGEAVEEQTVQYLHRKITELLPQASAAIDMNRNFLDLGVSSNDLVELVQDIETDLGVELYPTIFFEYQNIKEASQYLACQHQDRLAQCFGSTRLSEESTEHGRTAQSGDVHQELHTEMLAKTAVKGSSATQAEGDIAIIGISGKFAKSPDLQIFWDHLVKGSDLITEIPSDHFDYRPWFSQDPEEKNTMYSKWGSFIDDVDKFDAPFFNISPREAETMDPQLRLLLQELYHTAEDAGIIRQIRSSKTGMFVGSCFQDYSSEMGRVGKPVEPYDGSGNALTMYSNRPSFFFDLTGPSISVDTACSSSLVAIHLACQSLRNGECDMAFAAGINLLLSSWHYRYFCSIGALSPTGRCHTFDERADGYVPGEGIAAILLKPLKQAIADGDRIHGIIKGSAVNHGGYTPSITAPSMKMEAAVIAAAWEAAGINPETLGYIEAHGTGTKLGDPIEINAIKEAFKRYTDKQAICAVGSAKAHIGHAEGAAGIAGVIKAILSIQNKMIPAMPQLGELNSFIDLKDSPLMVNREPMPWLASGSHPRRAGVSSFGFGGAYAHLVVEEYRDSRTEMDEESTHLVILSAAQPEALKRNAKQLHQYLLASESPDLKLSAVAATLAYGREEFDFRLAITANLVDDLISKLGEFLADQSKRNNMVISGMKQPNHSKEWAAQLEQAYLNNNLEQVGQLWVCGAHVNWGCICRKQPPISLPGYSFEKKRYWVLDHYIAESSLQTPARLNALLDANQSTLFEQKFVKTLNAKDMFLQDHAIESAHVLPGVVSLEMIRAAALLANDRGGVPQIQDFQWSQSIELNTGELELYVELGLQHAQIHASVYSIASDGKRTHAVGSIVYETESIEQTKDKATGFDATAELNAIDQIVTGEACYDRLAALGLKIGPSLRSIQKLYIESDRIFAELQMDSNDGDAYDTHPALLDGAIQAIVGFSEPDDRILHIPYSIKSAKYFAKLGKKGLARIVLHPNSSRLKTAKEVDIVIYNEQGEPAVQFESLILKPVKLPAPVHLEWALFSNEWVETEASVQQVEHLPEKALLLTDQRKSEICDQIVSELALYGCAVEQTSSIQGSERIVEKLRGEENLDCIVILEEAPSGTSIDAQEADTMSKKFSDLYSLIQYLIRAKVDIPVYFITTHPLLSGIATFLQTASTESGFLRYKYVEIASGKQLADAIEEVVKGSVSTGQVRYQGGKRYERKLRDYTNLSAEQAPIFREGELYLISGGLGQIGRKLTEQAVRAADCRVVLIGRSILSKERMNEVRRLNLLNPRAEVIYRSCDVTDLQELDQLLRSIRKEYKPIDGIFHLAGQTNDSLIINKAPDQLHSVISPKLTGTVLLDRLTHDDPIRFMIAFSSITAIQGNAGQGDYTFANAFMDAYAALRNKRVLEEGRSSIMVSLNWPYWEDGGMRMSEEAVERLRQAYGCEPITIEQGIQCLNQLDLNTAPSSLLVLYGEQRKLKLIAETGSAPKVLASGRTNGSLIPNAKELGRLEEKLIAIYADIQRMDSDSIRPTVSLTQYGLESISISEFAKAVSKTLSITLMPSIFFEIDTIRELAALLAARYQEACAPYLSSELVTKAAQASESLASSEQQPVYRAVAAREVLREQELSGVKTANQNDGGPLSSAAEEPVAIIGIAGTLPSSENLTTFWKSIESGSSLISVVPEDRWDWNSYYGDSKKEANKTKIKWGGFISGVDEFDAAFFGISPREAELMDPQQRLFLQTVWEVIENAGYKASDLAGSKTGLFVGVGNFDYSDLMKERGISIDAYAATGIAHSVLANRISYLLDLHGPSMPVDTACSSSLVSIDHAVQAIARGYCDMAIAGGINLILNPNMTISFDKAGMLSEDGCCKTFDKDANGYVRGEGSGAILLKPLSRAREDGDYIHAVIIGSSVNHGGKVNSLTVPNPLAQADVIRDAHRRAGIAPETVSYIEAHGTGTPLGDPVEIQGLKRAFDGEMKNSRAYCGIGSVKTNIGHLETAAGIAGILKVVMALTNRKLPANAHFQELNPYIELEDSPFYVVDQTRAWERLQAVTGEWIPRRAGVSSFGFGGANAHIVLEEFASESNTSYTEMSPQLFVLSAQSEEQVKQYAKRLMLAVAVWQDDEAAEASQLQRIAYTLQIGRESKDYRLAIIADNLAELHRELEQFVEDEAIDKRNKRRIFRKADLSDLFLLDWNETEEMLEHIVRKRDLAKIASLWTHGVHIPWKLLYPDQRPQRLPLPTYPFLRSKYWLPDKVQRVNEGGQIHPMLDRNASNIEGLMFSKNFSTKDFYLRDHVLDGKPLLPGVAYLEMALAGAELANPGMKVGRLENLVWMRPIVLGDAGGSCTGNLKMTGQRTKPQLRVVTHESQGEAEHHFQCKVAYQSDNSEAVRETDSSVTSSLSEMKSRCTSDLSADQFYSAFEGIGLHLGGTMRAIRHVQRNDSEVLAAYSLPNEAIGSFAAYTLHPSILDAAITSPKGMLGGDAQQLYLPFAIESVEIVAPVTAKGYIYTAGHLQDDSDGKNMRKYDMTIMDESGRVTVRIRKFMARPYGTSEKIQYLTSDWVHSNRSIQKQPAASSRCIVLARSEYELEVIRKASPFRNDMSFVGVLPGSEFSVLDAEKALYQVNVSSTQDFAQLFHKLEPADELYVVYGWAMQARDSWTTDIQLQFTDRMKPLFSFTQSLHQELSRYRSCRLILLYGENSSELPFYAPMGAYLQSIARESSKLQAKVISLADLEADIRSGVEELLSENFDSRPTYYHNQQRRVFTQRIVEQEGLRKLEPIRKGATYLITGGLGELGLLCASYIAARGGNLILTGRRKRSDISSLKMQELEATGVSVRYSCCDVAEEDQVNRLIREIRQDGEGPIRGIIHAAGMIRDNRISEKRFSEFKEVVGGKVFGAVWLDKATMQEPLDFFILFSSLVGITGNAGQSDYAYANAFLNEFAQYRSRLVQKDQRQGNSLSIAWPLWEHGGMQVAEQQKDHLRQTLGLRTLLNEEGIACLNDLFNAPWANVAVFKGDAAKWMNLISPVLARTSASEPLEALQKIQWNERYTEIRDLMSKIIKSEQPIEPKRDLSAYGFDSITYTELANQLNEKYGIDLSPAIFFEYPTLVGLFDYLKDNFRVAFADSAPAMAASNVSEEKRPMTAPIIEEEGAIWSESVTSDTGPIWQPTVEDIQGTEEPEPIAVIGMSCVLPQSEDARQFWNNLIAGKDLIEEIPADRWDWRAYYGDPESGVNKTTAKWGGFIDGVSHFDAKFFRISPKEAALMDPQHRIFIQTVWKTVEDAGYKASDLHGTNTGIFVGISGWDYNEVLRANKENVESLSIIGIAHSVLPNRISYLMDWHGPSEPIDTACSSSLVAIHKAVEQIRLQNCDVAIAGGVNLILSPAVNISFNKAGMLSPDGRCKTFDKQADGYVRGEGTGAILLKPLSKAIQDGDHVYGVIRGTDLNHGGQVNSFTVPNPNAQAEVIQRALNKAKIDPQSVTYIETHGTGTGLGDPVEIAGLKKVFKSNGDPGQAAEPYCGLGAVKSNIGHLEAAAGIAGIIKVLLAMKHKKLPPTLHFNELNPYISLKDSPFYIVDKAMPWPALPDGQGGHIPRRAGVSSFGFGGVNAHIVLEEYQTDTEQKDAQEFGKPYLFLLSAKDSDCLKTYAESFKQWLSDEGSLVGLRNIAYTLQIGREDMKARLAMLAATREELSNGLDAFILGLEHPGLFVHQTGGASEMEQGALRINGLTGEGLSAMPLERAAALWVAGTKLEWKELYDKAVTRVSLPTYPFTHTQHWAGKRKNADLRPSERLETNHSPVLPEKETVEYSRQHPISLVQTAGMTFKPEWVEAGLTETEVLGDAALIIVNEASRALGESIQA